MIAFQHRLRFPGAAQQGAYDLPVAEIMPLRSYPPGLTPGPWQAVSGSAFRLLYRSTQEHADLHGLEVRDTLVLHWPDDRGIRFLPLEAFTEDRLQFWVLHTAMPLWLSGRGVMEILHVGAVQAGEQALVFAAPSMGGKSTLTGHCLAQGHPMLADDTLGVLLEEGRCTAIPGYPFHRPYRKAGVLGDPVNAMAQKPLPLKRIYCLDLGNADSGIAIEALEGASKFYALSEARFVQMGERAEQDFAFIGQLADAISVYRIKMPRSLAALPRVYSTVIKHLAG